MFLAVWGAPSGDRSGHRDRSSLRPSSPVPPRRAARSPSVRTRGVRRDIPPYSSVMNDEVTGPSLREGNRGMAQSNPLNCDVEPERAFCESDGMTPAAPEGGEPVSVERGASDTALTGGFMADATRSVVREGRESRSLKRPCECVPTEGAPEEKISRRDPYARVFRYNKGTPFVNDERACAEYFYLLRNAFTDIPDVDDLVHAQEFKDMSRSTAQVLLFPLTWSSSVFLGLSFFFLGRSRTPMRCGLCLFTRGSSGGCGLSWRICSRRRSRAMPVSKSWMLLSTA